VTEIAAVAARVRRGADGHDLEADRRGCNPQAHTENQRELDRDEDA
jgi:hypothetical protein